MFTMLPNILKKGVAIMSAIVLAGTALLPATITALANEPATGVVQTDVQPNNATYTLRDGNGAFVAGSPFTGSQSHELLVGSYTFEFQPLTGFDLPNPSLVEVFVGPNSNQTVNGAYQELISEATVNVGSLMIKTTPADATYNVSDGNGVLLAGAPFSGFNHFLDLQAGTYTVEFLPLDGFDAPEAEEVLILPDETVAIAGVYTAVQNAPPTGFLRVNITPESGVYHIEDGNGIEIAGSPFTGTQTFELIPGSYLISFDDLDGFVTPDSIEVLILPDNKTIADAVFVEAEFGDGNLPETGSLRVGVSPNSASYIIEDGNGNPLPGSAFEGTQVFELIPGSYTVEFLPLDGFITPDLQEVLIRPSESITVTGIYETGGGDGNPFATIAVTTDPLGGDANVTNSSGVNIPSDGNTLNFPVFVADDYTVNFLDVIPGFDAPANQTVTVSVADIQNGTIIPVLGQYIDEDDETATIRIEIDNVDQAVTDQATITLNGEVIDAAKADRIVNIADQHDISFGDVTGFTTPAPITILANTLVANSNPTLNPDTNLFVVSYEPLTASLVEVSKTASINQAADRVNYSITLTRTDSSTDSISVVLADSISGTQGILNGSNGGTLSLVPNSGEQVKNSAVVQTSVNMLGTIDLVLDDSDTVIVINYAMDFDKSTIPANQSSNFTNTAIATFNGETATSTIVTPLNGRVDVPTGGGGSRPNGGSVLVNGDMEIKVQRLVSTDGVNFRTADTHQTAVVLEENKDTRLFVKVSLENVGELTAKDIEYKHFFDTGNSDMTADGMQNLQGASLNNNGNIEIDEILVGGTANFSYEVLIHENGQSDQPAFDGVELVNFESKLPKVQDFLDYHGIGDQYKTFLFAGKIPPLTQPNVFGNADELQIKVITDRDRAAIGEVVAYTLQVANNTGDDLTNLILNHFLPNELEVVNSGAGRLNNNELQWKRAIVRPGEQIQFRFTAKVIGGAPDAQVRSLTSAMVNELEGVNPVESFLQIAAGAPKAFRLVQTGPMTNLILAILMSIASYFGYRRLEQIRYARLKAEALRF